MNSVELRKYLRYDPTSGAFTWLTSQGSAVNGKPAGCTHPRGYRRIVINGRQYQEHRLAWLYVYGDWPEYTIDHINGDKADNRIANIRDVPIKENCRNQSLSKNNSSGVNGVTFCKRLKKWKATIAAGASNEHLGYFDTKREAAAARASANNKHKYHQNHGKLGVAL